MKVKAILEGILVGVFSTVLSYAVLISPATIAAVGLRHKMPDAWFSSMIVWYSTFAVAGLSVVIGGVALRIVHKHVSGSTPKS